MLAAVAARPFTVLLGGTVWSAVVRRDGALLEPFVVVLLPASLAGMARRDGSLDEGSAATSRPIASPHDRARWGEHDLSGYATRDLFRPKTRPIGQGTDAPHNWTEGLDASNQLCQLFTVRFDDEKQVVHVGALVIRCLDDRDK